MDRVAKPRSTSPQLNADVELFGERAEGEKLLLCWVGAAH